MSNDINPRECRTCAHVVYGLRGKATCDAYEKFTFEVALDQVCGLWTERPDPFEPREGDDK